MNSLPGSSPETLSSTATRVAVSRIISLCYFVISLLFLTPNPGWAVEVTVYDVLPGPDAYVRRFPININGAVFFAAADDSTYYVTDLWGVAPGSSSVLKLTTDCIPYELTAVKDTLFFACFNDSAVGGELWKIAGTAASALLVTDFPGSTSPKGMTDINGTLFFSVDGGNSAGRELWKVDGETGISSMVRDITPGPDSTIFYVFPTYPNFIAVGSTLFFVADNGVSGQELWKSDGSPAGTVLIKDINAGSGSSMIFSDKTITIVESRTMIDVNGTLFFQANDGSNGYELWKTDGTAAGTVMVKDIVPGPGSSSPNDFAISNGTLFFAANNALWKTDGTESGTVMVKNIGASWLIDIGDTLFFGADDGINGSEPWISDGTTAGTVMLKNINGNATSSDAGKPVAINGLAYFYADDGVNGSELWVSDGTEEGTQLLVDITAGSEGSFINELINANGTLFFRANYPGAGSEMVSVKPPPPGPSADSTANYRYASTNLDPINTFTGELFSRKPRDLELGGPMPLYFERYYSSYLRRSFIVGDLGSNWRHNFDARLYWVGNTITYVTHDGRTSKFIEDTGTGVWTQKGNTDTPYQLSAITGQDVRIYDPEIERIYTFDYTTDNVIMGKLVKIEDGKGNAHTLTYNNPTNAQLASVSDGLGRTLTFTYNGDTIPKISVVSDGMRTISYQYTDPIDTEYLTLVSDGLPGFSIYVYKDTSTNADHALMLSMTRPRGNVPYTQTFFDVPDPTSGRVASQTDANGNTFSFDYSGLETTLTDPLGNNRVHTHTATGEFSSRQDETGDSFTMGSDSTGRRNSITDRLGDTTTIDYDAPSGNVAAVTNADGGEKSFAYTPRTFNGFTFYDMTRINHADGTHESLTYDANGNAISHTDQLGNISTATFNAYAQPLTVTNVAGGITTKTYNVDATLASIKDPVGNITQFSYDSFKRLNLVTHPDASTRALTYNDKNQLLSLIDENGNQFSMTYDVNANLASFTDPLLNTTLYNYDGNDRQISTTDALGNISSRSFDAFGRISTITDKNGNVTTFAYDVRGRLTRTTDPEGNPWSNTYDAEAILTSTTDPLNNATAYQSDSMGRITRTTSPMGHSTRIQYDTMGRITGTTDPLSKTTTYSYDERGLLSRTTLPGGNIRVHYTRDALGNITTITDPNGNDWLSSYDQQNRPLGNTDPLGNVQTISYDNRSRPTTITYPASLGTQTIRYDVAGNITRRSYSDGTTTNFTYDANNRLLSADGISFAYDTNDQITENNGIAITRDAGGHITAMTLASSKAVSYRYDANDRVTQVSDWAGGITIFSYDAAGRLISVDRPNSINTTQQYDADSRLIGITESTLSSINLTRDAKGQITRATRDVPQAASATALSNNSDSFNAAAQRNSATHDAMGRLTHDGSKTLSWDLASRLIGISDGNTSVSATYDAMGMRISRNEAGTTQNYIWNYALGLTSISIEQQAGSDTLYYIHTPDGRLLYSIDATSNARHFYHYDEMGNTLFITDDAGTVIGSYAYTPYGRLIVETGGLDNPFTWQGQFGVMADGGDIYYIRARYYDSASARFINRDPIMLTSPNSVNPYTYALNNPLWFFDPEGEDPHNLQPSANNPLVGGDEREALKLHAPKPCPKSNPCPKPQPPTLQKNLEKFSEMIGDLWFELGKAFDPAGPNPLDIGVAVIQGAISIPINIIKAEKIANDIQKTNAENKKSESIRQAHLRQQKIRNDAKAAEAAQLAADRESMRSAEYANKLYKSAKDKGLFKLEN